LKAAKEAADRAVANANKDMDKSFKDQLAAKDAVIADKDRDLKAQSDAALSAKKAADKTAAEVCTHIIISYMQ